MPSEEQSEPDRLEARASEPAPLLGSWRAVYIVVLAELGVLVALFYALGWWST